MIALHHWISECKSVELESVLIPKIAMLNLEVVPCKKWENFNMLNFVVTYGHIGKLLSNFTKQRSCVFTLSTQVVKTQHECPFPCYCFYCTFLIHGQKQIDKKKKQFWGKKTENCNRKSRTLCVFKQLMKINKRMELTSVL